MLSISDNNQADVFEAFDSASRSQPNPLSLPRGHLQIKISFDKFHISCFYV